MPEFTLTRIRLNPHHKMVRADLADPVRLHRTLMRLAPDHLGTSPRREAGLLFRLDRDSEPVLLVQMAGHPQLAALPPGYGTAHHHTLTAMLHALTQGTPVRYRITANPTTYKPSPIPAEGRRPRGTLTALTGTAATAWWHRHSTQAGLDILTTTATPQPGPRHNPDDPRPFHPLTRFDGTARITDPDLLRTAVTSGIGRAKAYGAGLLSLAPA
ncbi:type I-E CRISPR-associated protein Cas6/Cse3/CasE [Kitasatospora phosalacinea]|uniref:Type I-E CRISPR-associated protein Cas6/Cse3/CasE n=1 Tax=Kitasatospora phosalacinea TaxID=2065 RepID=A0A9W6PIH0_9ACTN|nr:type I-E CRISPR-associated protein Cas6/Cse3/CasE [Kitasatospora phosalacinea]GLW56799.1 type I-E CRISPR-associated protein Cas6/Cse3/CasE [Kitasatospora phosalacinea]